MKIFTSKEIRDNPEIMQEEFSMNGGIKYYITQDEMGWLKFIKNKYDIADYLYDHLTVDSEKRLIVHIEYDYVWAIDDDCEGLGKAVMLSDETALQAIFFWNYIDL